MTARRDARSAVCVDNMRIPFGRMRMSHLMTGRPEERLDVSDSKRKEALGMGAVPADGKKMLQLIRAKREAEKGKGAGR